MNIKEIIGELNVGAHGICLAFQGRIPLTVYNNQTFKHLWGSIEIIPEMSDAK